MTKPPFKLKQRKTACENSVFTVFFDHLVDTGKTLVEDYLVVEPKNKATDSVTGVAVLPLYKGKIGLIHIYRHAVGQFAWEVPRGFVESGETHLGSAVRELYEETGIEVREDELEDYGIVAPEPGIISGLTKIFIAKPENIKDAINPAEYEIGHLNFIWVDIKSVVDLINKNKIIDSTTTCAIHKLILNSTV